MVSIDKDNFCSKTMPNKSQDSTVNSSYTAVLVGKLSTLKDSGRQAKKPLSPLPNFSFPTMPGVGLNTSK